MAFSTTKSSRIATEATSASEEALGQVSRRVGQHLPAVAAQILEHVAGRVAQASTHPPSGKQTDRISEIVQVLEVAVSQMALGLCPHSRDCTETLEDSEAEDSEAEDSEAEDSGRSPSGTP